MKKLFPGILAMVMCFGMLAACGDNNKPSSSPDSSPADSSSSSSVTPTDPHEATLNDVKSYVHEQLIKKNYETRKDFTLMNSFSFIGEDVKYDISWSVDVEEGVTIVEGETEDTVVIGELSEDLPFILTGTITDPEGCHSVQFTLEGLALKALSEVPTAITEAPVEGEAYKYHVYQSTLAKDMYFVGDMDGFYFKTTEVAAEAVDVFVEYKAGSTTEFYPWFNHAENGKQYIGVKLSDNGEHDNIVYASEPVSVFVWNAELGTITTHLDKNKEGKAADYYLGNYSTYDTISASMLSYAGGAGNNVGHLVKMVDKNSITPDKKVAEEKEKLSVVSEVIGEKSIELIAKGNTYSDVAIAWEVSGNNAVIENGVLKLSVPATADETVTLTATITCGDVTDTKVFSILLKKYELPAADSEISIPKALEIGETLKGNTEAKYYISGTVTSVENTTYGNIYIEDANGNSIYVYGIYSADGTTRYDAMENAPQVGDTVKLYSIVSYYKAAQLKNAWVVEWTPGEEQPPVDSSSSNTDVPPADDSSSSNTDVPPADDSSSSNTDTPSSSEDSTTPSNPTTPAEIVNALYALADNESMTGPFTVTGVITALDTYNNPTIVVENMTDKPVYCYKLKDDRFVVGATITVTADSMKNYKGTYEFMNCTLDSIELPGDVPPADDSSSSNTDTPSSSEDSTTPSNPTTPAEIVNAAYALEKGASLSGTYTLTGVVFAVTDAFNSQYNNVTVIIIVDGMTDKPMTCYRMKGEGADIIGKADTITVTGAIKNYNGTVEFDSGCTLDSYVLHVCSEYSAATCVEPETCVACGETKNDVLAGHNYVNGTCSVCGNQEGVASITASKTMAELITSEGWDKTTTKQEFALDDVVTVKVDGGSNTGKAYNGDHIRIYATDTPAGTLTISLADGYELVSIKITAAEGTYAFLCVDGTDTDICNTTALVSGSSVVLNSVKNGSDGKQVRVMAIEVVYKAA